jgi:aryl-alcohol dehydrogenase-like predicted oxidoreductase
VRQRRVGSSGLRVGRLGLGTLSWGRETPLDEAAALLHGFRDAGGSLLCTSDGFGAGAAEDIAGRLLTSPQDRGDVVLVAQTGAAGTAPGPGSRRSLLAALDASLDRLRTDHADIWLVRGLDPLVPLAEILGAVERAVSSGRAHYVGLTDVAGWQFAAAAASQQVLPGRQPLVVAHAEWSLLARDCERELLPAVQASGAGLLPWSPLGRGVLTGKYRGGTPRDSRAANDAWRPFVAPYLGDASVRVVDAVLTAADGLGVSPAVVALAWIRDRAGVVAPVIGPRTAGQLQAALASEPVTLPVEIVQALDEVSALPPSGPEVVLPGPR